MPSSGPTAASEGFDPKALAQKGKGGTPDDLKAALDDMAERMGKGEKSAEGESDQVRAARAIRRPAKRAVGRAVR